MRQTSLFVLVVLSLCSCFRLAFAQARNALPVLSGTQLSDGFDMGVNSSGHRTDWLSSDPPNGMKMAYPANQQWGAVFITVGPPKDPPRPSTDLSIYRFLIVELKGEPGREIQIGAKSATDPDDGTEIKQTVKLTADWQSQIFPLSGFASVDFSHTYVACEFVFSGPVAQTVWVREVRYTTSIASGTGVVLLRAQSGVNVNFSINGGMFYQTLSYRGYRGGPGIHIAVLHEVTCEIEDMRHYDTSRMGPDKAAPDVLAFLNSIPDGRIVLAAVSGLDPVSYSVMQMLQTSFGSHYVTLAWGYNSWAMITRKAATTSLAESFQPADSLFTPETTAEAKVTLADQTDTAPPTGRFLINGGATQTVDNRVMLDLSSVADDSGLVQGGKMKFSNDGMTWTRAEDFKPTTVWYLERGSGSKTVYARFRDRDGNWSASISTKINFTDPGALRQFPDSGVDTMCFDETGAIYSLAGGNFRVSRNDAVTWTQPQTILPKTSRSPVLACGGGGLIALALDSFSTSSSRLLVNTSVDFGNTWMATPASLPVAASVSNITAYGYGTAVYVSWTEWEGASRRLMVGSSTDFGVTWRYPVVVNTPETDMESPDFAVAAPDDQAVLIIWGARSGDMLLARSVNRGVTFAPPQVLGSFGKSGADPYLWTAGTGTVYATWSSYSLKFRYSQDSGATWAPENPADSKPCYWNASFLPDAIGNILVSCLIDESFAAPGGSSLNFNRRVWDPWWSWLPKPIRINSNQYSNNGSVYGPPDVNASVLSAQDHAIVLAWEDARTRSDGRAQGWDIFWAASDDDGTTWLPQNIRLPGTLPYGGAMLWWAALGPQRKSYTFWSEGTSMYVDVRSLPSSSAGARSLASYDARAARGVGQKPQRIGVTMQKSVVWRKVPPPAVP